VSARTPDGGRTLVRTDDADAIDALVSADPLGWRATIAGPPGSR